MPVPPGEAARVTYAVSAVVVATKLDEDAAAGLLPDLKARFEPAHPVLPVSAMADDDFSPTFQRASTAYGMSPRIRFDLVVNNLTGFAVTTNKVFLKSDGSSWRPLVHIEDISRAFVATLEAAPVEHAAHDRPKEAHAIHGPRGVPRKHLFR